MRWISAKTVERGAWRYWTETVQSTASNEASSRGSWGFFVQVLHEKMVQARVARQFVRVHAVAFYVGERHLLRQVGHPRTHQIEEARAGAETLAVEGLETSDKPFIDVPDEPGLAVEEGVVIGVELGAGFGGKHGGE